MKKWMNIIREWVLFLERPIGLLGILLIFLGIGLNTNWIMILGIWVVIVYFTVGQMHRHEEKRHE